MNALILSAHALSLDRRIIAQANALNKNGYEVTLVSIPVPDDCSQLINVGIKQIIPFKMSAHHSNYLLDLKNIIKQAVPEKIREPIQFQRRKKFYKSLAGYFLKNTPQKKYSFIHAHDLITLPAAIAIRDSFSANAKIIYDAHELYPHQFTRKKEQKYWESLEQKALKEVDAIITINPGFERHFKKTYSNCPSSYILYNSYDLNHVPTKKNFKKEILERTGWSDNAPVCLFHGGLTHQRNLNNLVKAFHNLRNQCNLLIVGRGPARTALEEICRKNGLDNVHLLDWVGQSELPSILQSVDFGIIPYLFDQRLNHLYCTPNKLFEFIHFKLPVLSSNLPEIAYIIEEYKLGKTYELISISAFQNAIIDFLSYKKKVAPGNFESALQKYGWDQQEKILLKIYQSFS